MTDVYVLGAVSGLCLFGLILPGLTWACTRAWYSGAIEDRDARIARLNQELEAAGAVIEAAEQAGYIRADEPQGRHAR